MVKVRSTSEIIQNNIDYYRTSVPNLTTNPGSVARDVLIDGPSTQISRIYEELASIRSAQSIRLALGIDLDRLAQNFGANRRRGSTASGTILVTFSDIEADIIISKGDVVTANNGATFTVTNAVTISAVESNVYRAVASKFRSDLDFVGITDEFAAQVSVESTATGPLGNISKYAVTSISTSGASNVTNAVPFSGGSASEDDTAFKNRVLGIFAGANTGTEAGYRETARTDPAVLDVIVIKPGDPLMTRDGTQVTISEDGTRAIISEGTGGKVDIYIFGVRLSEIIDSFIYRDQSNKNDPTDSSNDFVLGQIEGDENKTVLRRRIDNLEEGVLPSQPVNDIIQVSGSSSGSNFVSKSIDQYGRITGNYELIRDDGEFGGTVWGFDKLHFISDRISDFSEGLSKGIFNGQDPVSFSDVLEIIEITQDRQVINENSSVSASDRTSIQLAHKPVSNVTRVFNLTTGERYVVSSQNPDGSGQVNETGRITIRGNTLPLVSDTLQVDYTWVFNFDSNFDYDNRITDTNPRSVLDSVDWGFSNAVRRERQNVEISGDLSTITVTHPVTSVVKVNTFEEETGTIALSSGRLSVVVGNSVSNVVSIVRDSDNAELYDTTSGDGTFSGLTIYLPTDTVAEVSDSVTVVYNSEDVFTVDDVSGSFSDNTITLSSGASISAGTLVECSYIANVRTLLPATLLSALPVLRNDNSFKSTTTTGIGVQPTTHVFSSPGVVEQNLRQAPSRLQLNISGSISPGVLTVSGTTFTGVFEKIFTVSNSGLTHDLSTLVRESLGLSSVTSIPDNVSIARLIKLEKVSVSSVNSSIVMGVEHTYDTKGYAIRDNTFVKSESIIDSSLTTTQIKLPSTSDNNDNLPAIGEKLRVTFYISKTDDAENVAFSKSGTLSTQKRYAIVDSISKSSGFTSGASQSATLTISNINQPTAGSTYDVTYDYTSPKSNERITIRYNQNKLLADTQLLIEENRPISADVLVKVNKEILADITMKIVLADGFGNSASIVTQNVRDAITSALNASRFGTTIDESDIINIAYTVEGVDRARTTQFNRVGIVGKTLSIEAQKNEVIRANTVTVETETR